MGFVYKRHGLESNTVTVSGIERAPQYPCSLFPSRHVIGLHFPAFLAVQNGHVTVFWPME